MPNTKKGDNMKKTKVSDDIIRYVVRNGSGQQDEYATAFKQATGLKLRKSIIHKKARLLRSTGELIDTTEIETQREYITDTDGVKNQNAVSRARLPEKNNEERR
jgi:hypothetical protein